MIPGGGAPMFIGGGRSSLSKTDFMTHIATRGTNRGSNSGASATPLNVFTSGSGTYNLILTSDSSSLMYGSPWGAHATNDSPLARFLLHCAPSASVATTMISNSDRFLMTVVSATNTDTPAVARNGYTSQFYAPSYTNFRCTEFTFWDSVLAKARTVNPYVTGSYTEYFAP